MIARTNKPPFRSAHWQQSNSSFKKSMPQNFEAILPPEANTGGSNIDASKLVVTGDSCCGQAPTSELARLSAHCEATSLETVASIADLEGDVASLSDFEVLPSASASRAQEQTAAKQCGVLDNISERLEQIIIKRHEALVSRIEGMLKQALGDVVVPRIPKTIDGQGVHGEVVDATTPKPSGVVLGIRAPTESRMPSLEVDPNDTTMSTIPSLKEGDKRDPKIPLWELTLDSISIHNDIDMSPSRRTLTLPSQQTATHGHDYGNSTNKTQQSNSLLSNSCTSVPVTSVSGACTSFDACDKSIHSILSAKSSVSSSWKPVLFGSSHTLVTSSSVASSGKEALARKRVSKRCLSSASESGINQLHDKILGDFAQSWNMGTCPSTLSESEKDTSDAMGAPSPIRRLRTFFRKRRALTPSIVRRFSTPEEDAGVHIKALLLLRICGIVRWTNVWSLRPTRTWQRPEVWYEWFILLLAASCCILYGAIISHMQTGSRWDDWCLSSPCLRAGLWCDMILGLGSLLGLCMVRYCRQALDENFQLLQSYAKFGLFEHQWLRKVHKDAAITVLLWIIAVAERVRGLEAARTKNSSRELDMWDILEPLIFSVSTFIICSIAFCILYFCRGMSCIVDSYCIHITSQDKDILVSAVPRWNIVQAILRKTSGSVNAIFFVLQTTVILIFLLASTDFYHSLHDADMHVFLLIPPVLVIFSILRILFMAAEVTSKCIRIPSLINACEFGSDIDQDRQYIVQYVLNSAAGYYLFETRLTSSMTFKVLHVAGVACLALVTHILN